MRERERERIGKRRERRRDTHKVNTCAWHTHKWFCWLDRVRGSRAATSREKFRIWRLKLSARELVRVCAFAHFRLTIIVTNNNTIGSRRLELPTFLDGSVCPVARPSGHCQCPRVAKSSGEGEGARRAETLPVDKD